jgi:energy-coupling factor transporter transmembrane protein EcfT
VHRLDARAKLTAASLVAVASVLATSPLSHAAVLVVLVLAFAAARLPARLVADGVRGAVWIALFVVIANVGWEIVLRRGPSWAAGEGAARSPLAVALVVARLFELVLLALLVTATTVPVDAAEAVERLLRPLARLHLPVHELGTLLVLSLSFVPLFAREARTLADAHRIKMGGARWTPLDRVRSLAPLVVPLFLAVVRRADELAVALDARCFAPGAPRTSLSPGRWGRAETAAVGVAALVVLGARL